jgi:hypothetical protein
MADDCADPEITAGITARNNADQGCGHGHLG